MYTGEVRRVKELVQKIAVDLQQRYPDADADFYFGCCANPRPQRTTGTLQTVVGQFESSCSTFPGAWVCYKPDHPYGLVVKVVGHCGRPSEQCARMCRNYLERPCSMLVLTRVGTKRIEVGSYYVPTQAGPTKANAKLQAR
jgi:hypothetical protein